MVTSVAKLCFYAHSAKRESQGAYFGEKSINEGLIRAQGEVLCMERFGATKKQHNFLVIKGEK